MKRIVRIALAVSLVATAAACGGSSSSDTPATPTPTGSTSWTGTVVGAGSTGSISIVFASAVPAALRASPTALVAAAAPVAVTGTLQLVGQAAIALTGTYDPTTQTFTVTGSGYAFSGTVTATQITGSFTFNGSAAGTFGAVPGTTASVVVYCGSYWGSNTNGGAFNLVQSGNTLTGIAFDDPAIGLSGTVSGTAASITFTVVRVEAGQTYTLQGSASGTFTGANNASLSGTWTMSYQQTPVDSGSFEATKC